VDTTPRNDIPVHSFAQFSHNSEQGLYSGVFQRFLNTFRMGYIPFPVEPQSGVPAPESFLIPSAFDNPFPALRRVLLAHFPTRHYDVPVQSFSLGFKNDAQPQPYVVSVRYQFSGRGGDSDVFYVSWEAPADTPVDLRFIFSVYLDPRRPRDPSFPPPFGVCALLYDVSQGLDPVSVAGILGLRCHPLPYLRSLCSVQACRPARGEVNSDALFDEWNVTIIKPIVG
jgi:hypothetical protein